MGVIKLWLLVLTLGIVASTVLLGALQPRVASASDLSLTAVAVQGAAGQVELRVTWKWQTEPAQRAWWHRRPREELLAVSFDTKNLVFDSAEAPAGVGTSGEMLFRLDRQEGADGARRLFVIREGEDGRAIIRFREVWPNSLQQAAPTRVHLVFDHRGTPVRTQEVRIASPS